MSLQPLHVWGISHHRIGFHHTDIFEESKFDYHSEELQESECADRCQDGHCMKSEKQEAV